MHTSFSTLFLIINPLGSLCISLWILGNVLLYPCSHVLWIRNVILEVSLCWPDLYLSGTHRSCLLSYLKFGLNVVYHKFGMYAVYYSWTSAPDVVHRRVHNACRMAWYYFSIVQGFAVFAKGFITGIEPTFLGRGSKGFGGGWLGGLWHAHLCVILYSDEELILFN